MRYAIMDSQRKSQKMKIHSILILLLFQLIHLGVYAQNLNEELIVATRKSNVEAVKSLLAKGADVNAKTEYGATPLFFACDRGNVEVVKLLLDAGADVNITDRFYKSPPVFWAVMKDHGEIARLLIEKGARTKESVIFSAVAQGKKKVVKSLLELGGFTPENLSAYLAAAEKNGNQEIAELLRSAGAKPKPKVEYKIDAEALKLYEGVFKTEVVEITVKIKEGKLVGNQSGQEFTLIPVDKHTFEIDAVAGLTLVFKLEADKVTGLTVKNPGGQTEMKKVEAK
jgi:ankyrin repeat protein